MLKYISEEEYINLLGGESIPSKFNELVIKASSEINRQTMGRIDENNVSESVKFATCQVIKLMSESEIMKSNIGNLKSQNIEGWSETYSTPEEIDQKLKSDIVDVLKTYLSEEIGKDGNLLLYRGV